MEAFWQEWEWLGWLLVGGIAIWVVLTETYRIRPPGQGREDSDYDSKFN